MSTISSLYGSPAPSTMSRDPAGINPNGVDDNIRLEPAGSRAEESMAYSVMSQQSSVLLNPLSKQLDTIDVAKLVGAPPPPPPTSPPKKNRSRGGTPRGPASSRSGTPRSNPYFLSDDESSNMESFERVTPDSQAIPDTTFRTRNTADSPDSLRVDEPLAIGKTSIVEERLKAAMATYQSEELMLDVEGSSTDVLRPAMARLENKPQTAQEKASTDVNQSVTKGESTPVAPHIVASPSSEVTRPFSNKAIEAKLISSASSGLSNISEAPSDDALLSQGSQQENEHKGKKKKKGFFKKIFGGRNKKQGQQEPVAKSPNRPTTTQKVNGSTKPVDLPKGASSPKFASAAVPSPKSIASQHSKEVESVESSSEFPELRVEQHTLPPTDSQSFVGGFEVIKPPTPKKSQGPLKSVLKGVNDRNYQGPALNSGFDDAFVKETAATSDASLVSSRTQRTIAQDPPDDEHGDPPENSGRPLLSPTSINLRVTTSEEEEEENSRIESVRSRIADLYDEHANIEDEHAEITNVPSNMTNDRQEFQFVQDEVSALTGMKSFDRSAIETVNSEPIGASPTANPSTKAQDGGPMPGPGERNVDPYSRPFFEAEDGGLLPTPSHLSQLRVEVQEPSVDPAGASPLKWDFRTQQARIPSFRDPVGESPMHAPMDEAETSDPPLTAGFVDDESSVFEEKKEEEVMAMKLVKPLLSGTEESQPSVQIPKGAPQMKASSSPIYLSAQAKNKGKITAKRAEMAAKKVEVETDIEKTGFKSNTNTPIAGDGKKKLTVAAAAFTNAKAIAYLHHLQGEPSPRHTWHASSRKQPEASPVAAITSKKASKKKKSKQPLPLSQKPNPAEYGAHNFDESQIKCATYESSSSTIKSKEGAMFSAYNSKFQGRKPSKKGAKPETPTGRRVSAGSQGHFSAKPKPQPVEKRVLQIPVVLKPGKITSLAVAKGIKLRRSKRDDDIASGKSERVILTPRPKTEGRNRFNFFPADESEIKDPIQRAGRRLLSKSAIPIQCAARRYIAKCEAIDRMWALIEIQSCFRRWRCETNLQASIHSAVVIQKSFRGWLAREKLQEMQYSATQVQKIVRGYLAQAEVYDTMYYIVRIQAIWKGSYTRKIQTQKKQAAAEIQRYIRGYQARYENLCSKMAVPVQAVFRGYMARQDYAVAIASACMIQASWRAYAARMTYQFEIVDVIIVQSIVRRWSASRRVQAIKNLEFFEPACKIQSAWRGFRCYTDYIFALVDVLVVQRTARQWLARRRVRRMKDDKAATKIQSCWRRQRAQRDLLFSLVHIIIAQSVARRFLSKNRVNDRKAEIRALQSEEVRRHEAATDIQRVWRGFWSFSHFIIIQYEITRLQALVRGRFARQNYNLKLGCAIIIQATMRRYLAKKAVERKVISDAVTESSALELRERNAAKRIQFWWRIVMDWTREKKAALTIERFFLRVRAEVDREIARRERKKMLKKEKRRRSKQRSDQMLDHSFLNTVDENTAFGESRSGSETRSKSTPRSSQPQSKGARSHSAPRQRNELVVASPRDPALRARKLVPPSPRNLGQEVDINGWPIQNTESTVSCDSKPTDAVRMAVSEDHSEVSNITNPSVFHGRSTPRKNGTQRQGRDKRMSTEDYIKKYSSAGGSQQTPTNQSAIGESQHFFSDEASIGSTRRKSSGGNATPSPSQAQLQLNTPRKSGTPTSSRRSSGGIPPSRTPRHQVPSPRIAVGFPPVTPRSQKVGASKLSIARRETADTESQTTYGSGSFSKASPRQGPSVMVMKHYPNFGDCPSMDEAQELMYLGSDDFGSDFGEV